jgi:hypothetical protein
VGDGEKEKDTRGMEELWVDFTDYEEELAMKEQLDEAEKNLLEEYRNARNIKTDSDTHQEVGSRGPSIRKETIDPEVEDTEDTSGRQSEDEKANEKTPPPPT